MRIFKKTVSIIMVLITIHSIIFESYFGKLICAASAQTVSPIKVSILISNSNLSVVALIMENMKKVEQENPGTVEYTFYDGKGNQNIQNAQLNTILTKKDVDYIMLDLADVKYTKYAVDRIKENNLPVIFLGNADTVAIMSYNKAYWVGPNPVNGGILQGSIIVDVWEKNKPSIDRNNDNILDYIMIEGTPTNIYALARTKFSIITANENNIVTREIATKVCNWKEDEAKEAVSSLLLRYGNKVEAIIANDDTMAIGAIKALQEYRYNLSNKSEKIIVIGFDGIQEAQKLIEEGIMTGTVLTDVYIFAKDFYTIGLNLMNNKNLIEGTDCTIDSTGKIITAPYGGTLVNVE